MAFDQNSIPKDLRPINVARTVSEEPRIVPPPATTIIARNPEGFVTSSVLDGGSPESATVYYPSPVSDAGFVGVGYGNLVPPTVSQWGPRMLAPVSHPAFTPVVGFGYSPSPVVVNPGIASDITYSGMATGFPDNQNLSNQVGGSGMDLAGNDFSARLNFNPGLVSRVGNNAVDQTSIDTFRGVGYSPSSANRSDQMSEESGDDSVSGKKIKFLCSFGGKILPRPSDGKLRYVGGQTRIISVRRDVHFNEMVQKMMDTYGHPVVIKYQLPDEDLDALISVSCPDDLDIMLDEFEKLVERSSDSSAKLRLFLFSASELDPSGMVQFRDLHDSGQTYVDAVNGIIDGPRGPIARKESLESGTSMQNSDYGGSEPVDGSIHGQVDASAAQITTDILSPRENFGTPHDTASGRMSESSHHAILLDTSSVQLGFPVVKSGPLPPQTSYSQSKVEVQSSVPLTISNQQMGMQQPRTEFAQPKPHLQAYVDPRQEPRVDHVQYPPLLGFPNPQLLGTSRPMYAQPQVHENTAGVAPHQFVHSVHMTMGPPSPHVNMRPNEVQPLMQPRLDRYAEESTFGPRVVQLPPDQSYNSYHVEVPSPMVADRLGWHQVTPSFEHVFPAGGLVHHPQVKVPEKFVRVENCYMCQKALPHAHSDIVAQDQRDGGASPVSDTSLVYHSLHLEDNSRAQPLNRVAVSGALGEYVVEPGGVTQPGVLGHGGNQVRIPPSEATGMSRNLLPQQGNERLVLQEGHNPDHLRISALPDAIVRRVGEVQSPYNAVIGAAPQFVPDGAFQKHLMQVRSQATPYATQPLSNDMSTDGGDASIQTSEHFLSPKEYSEKLSGMFSKDGASDTRISNHHLRPIDGNMGTLRLFSNDSCDTSDCSKSAGKEVGKVDNLDQKLQKVTGRGKMVVEMNQSNATEVPVCSSSQVLFVLNSRPLESVEGTKLPVWGNPDPFQQSKIGNNYLESDEIQYGKTPPYFGVEANHLTDGIPASAEQKADAALFRPNLVPSNVEATTNKNGDMQDSSSSLFSNQDPWNLHHDTHLMPPRTNELDSRKEAFPTGDPFVGTHIQNFGELRTATQVEDGFDQQLGNFNKDSNSEHVQSAKDSAGSAEEQIKQDLQAVAEGVAASVLQSATSSNPDSQEKNEPMSGASQEGDVGNVNVDLQPKTQIEEKRTKLPEKANLGFPVSASIGRLQIIKNSDLEELRELGSGTFGTVYHGKWKGTDVAIKRINDRCFVGKPSEQDRMREDFWNEAVNLADLHHPNVVAFYGVVLDGPSSSVATVTEYMVNGSLRNALQKNENSLDKRKLLLIAMDVAFGMEYLHGKNIVHFDLKSDNLLVNLRDSHRPICKVGDLGLSKVKCQTLISGGVRGTLPWMAPELLNGSSSLVSEKVDVFSFGIVLWELLTGEEPYTDLHYGAIIGGIVSNTLRPPIPEYCDREWKSLMERCWSSEPSERPSFTEIANELRSMASKTPPKGQNQQHSPAQK